MLIPKGGSDFQGYRIVEVLWKTVVVILNFQFDVAITLHSVLNGLQAGRGTGTTYLEAKLIQKLMVMSEEVM